MTDEEALVLLDQLLQQEHLNTIQEQIFYGCWNGETYIEMSDRMGYDADYIKDTGAKLWKFLSEKTGERINKNNVQSVLKRLARSEISSSEALTSPPVIEPNTRPIASAYIDWGEAIDVSTFYGRTIELATLKQWVLEENCRSISIVGMGGIGKTALSVKLSEVVASEQVSSESTSFSFFLWRTLRNAPPVEGLVADLIRVLSGDRIRETDLPLDAAGRVSQLMEYLQAQRCLLVLDNIEALLQDGTYSGYFQPKHEGYSELLQRLAQTSHQSCLIITSRENPRNLTALEGTTLPVRSLHLNGLASHDCKAILEDKGTFSGTEANWQTLSDCYSGNPLALKIVASTIQDLFNGNLSEFLAQGTFIFDDIRSLLGQQFNRLSPLEKSMMYWLAIAREPISFTQLQEDIIPAASPSKLMEAVGSLMRRSLIERSSSSSLEETIHTYTQQPVVMEYVTDQFVEAISLELNQWEQSPGSHPPHSGSLFQTHALLKASAKDYIRDRQSRFVVEPILEKLMMQLHSKQGIEQQLHHVLADLQVVRSPGYAVGNFLNLFRQLGSDLTGYDFSGLTVWSAYLPDVSLHQVNFAGANLAKSVFAQTLGNILAVAFSPDGKLLAGSDGDGKIRIWQTQDGRQILTCSEHQDWVKSIAFVPQDTQYPERYTLASSGADQIIRLWDVNTGQSYQDFRGHTNWVWAIAFSPTGQRLISASEDGTIRLWDVAGGECLQVLTGHQGGVCAVAFSPDGQVIVSGGEDQQVRLWQMETGSVKVLSGHRQRIRAIAFSAEGQWFASGGDDGIVKVWDAEVGECLQTIHCNSRIWSIAALENNIVATGSDDNLIKLWDIQTGYCLKTFQGHNSRVWTIAFSPDRKTLASGSDDQTLKLWELNTVRCVRTFQGYNNWVWSAAFSSDGSCFVSAGEDGKIRLWDAATYDCNQVIDGHRGRIWTTAFSPQGQLLVSGGDDQTIRIWQIATGRCLKILQERSGQIRKVEFSPDGNKLATNNGDSTVKIWDVSQLYSKSSSEPSKHLGINITVPRLRTLNGHLGRVYAIAFLPNSDRLITGSEDQTIRLWDTHIGDCLNIFEGHSRYIFSVAASSVPFKGKQLIASGSNDQTIRFWDLQTGECLRTLEGHQGWIQAIAFSPDGTILISGSTDKTIKLWDIESGMCLRTLEGHTKEVRSISLSPDGRKILSGSEDETLKIWQMQTGECLQTLRASRPYEEMNITNAQGLTDAQRAALLALGAYELEI
jgi:WD40 repeat protein